MMSHKHVSVQIKICFIIVVPKHVPDENQEINMFEK